MLFLDFPHTRFTDVSRKIASIIWYYIINNFLRVINTLPVNNCVITKVRNCVTLFFAPISLAKAIIDGNFLIGEGPLSQLFFANLPQPGKSVRLHDQKEND